MTKLNPSSQIHPTAIIADTAELGAGCTVGPFSVIGPHVKLGQNNQIGSHVVIEGYTSIGNGNRFFQFASVGAIPQDLKYHGEASQLILGDNNIVREYVTLQPGTEGGGMLTRIGNKNLFMACVHVGHDGVVGDNNVFANAAMLAGHVTVGSGAIVGGLVGIHQFVRIGDSAMLGGGTMVVKDIPPYMIAQGDRAGLVGVNSIGLQRLGFSDDEIKAMERAYRSIFMGKGLWSERLAAAESEFSSQPRVLALLNFIKASERGVTMPRRTVES